MVWDAFPLEKEVEAVAAIAVAAGHLILKIRESGFECQTKGDNTLVTSADYEADTLIAQSLQDAFPGDRILSEESGGRGPEESTTVWVVDPLDGTQAFAGGKDTFTVLIGRIQVGVPTLGVVHFPVSGETFVAQQGRGAIRLDTVGGVQNLAHGKGVKRQSGLALSPSTPAPVRQQFRSECGLECGPEMYGAGAKFMSLARGDASAYVSGHPLSLWDLVAPWVILSESGGILTNERAEPVELPESSWEHFPPTRIVATIGEDHDAICTAVRTSRSNSML